MPRYGIKVLLDLHALPGSQNGEIHSGVCIEALWLQSCSLSFYLYIYIYIYMYIYNNNNNNNNKYNIIYINNII